MKIRAYTILLSVGLPVIGAVIHAPFVFIMAIPVIFSAVGIFIDVKDQNFIGVKNTFLGLLCLFAIYAFIYSTITGIHIPTGPESMPEIPY